MRKLPVFITFCGLICAQAWGVEQRTPIICRDGDLHDVVLREVAPGTPGAHEVSDVKLGPSKTAWLTLPDRASLSDSQTQPVPVPDLGAGNVEVRVKFPGGRQQTVQVRARDSAADGATKVTLIRAQISARSYALPENCRVLHPPEVDNYAEALLNNAGCLLPPDMHQALGKIPGAGQQMLSACGWESDPRLAVRALQKSADRGSKTAGWILSQILLGSVEPKLLNHREALVQLSRTAGLGHASADLMTGIMRWRGDGLKTNPQAAFTTLLPHARRGSREAQGIIGTMYLTGQGVPMNPIQAYAWCHLAAANAPLLYTDPLACRDAAEGDLSLEEVLDARDLAVEIHNGHY